MFPRTSRKSSDHFERYNLWWPPAKDPASIELEMINKGGKWQKKNGETAGEGLFFHYKEFIKIIWPWVVHHKWFDLILENYLTHRTIVLIGPASSSKTFTSAILVLVDYFAHPNDTTVICCSTTKERLQDRVWADIVKLFRSAKKERPWMPGHLIEGRLRIITDSRKDSPDGRDFRNGCFPTGTLVNTPFGGQPIESLKPGDVVLNATGIGTIKETHSRTADRLIRITLSDGRTIECTDEHPIFTQKGWTQAIDVETSDTVFSSDETLQILSSKANQKKRKQEQHILLGSLPQQPAMPGVRQAGWEGLSGEKFLLHEMPGLHASRELPSMREGFQGSETEGALARRNIRTHDRKILQPHMLGTLGFATSRNRAHQNSEVQNLRHNNDRRSFLAGILLSEMQTTATNNDLSEMWENFPVFQGQAQIQTRKVLQPGVPYRNTGTDHSLEPVSRIHDGASGWEKVYRRGVSENKTGRGIGWQIPQNQNPKQTGRTENQGTHGERVVGSEVLERGSGAGFDKSSGVYHVHNLSVSGHPSYSVNGVIVHNCVGVPCKRGETYIGISEFAGIKNKRVRLLGDELSMLPRAFVDAISNLDKNPDFKCIGLGNPKDTTDALGVLGEPAPHLGGWESGIDQAFGTKTWAIKRDEGICIQLPGDDSPNLDGKLGIPLISQEMIDRDVSFYGKESVWYTMMNLGRMPRGAGSRRVLTRQLCEKFGALLQPLWRDSNLKRIAFMDAAYGGDRCIFGELVFGYEAVQAKAPVADASGVAGSVEFNSNTHQIIALVDTVVVPVNPALDVLVEDQIVAFTMKQCELRGIQPENFFYDPGMRSALVQAFSRIWSKNTEAVDCGGRPSDEPVSADIQKPCDEYYSKKISALWFSVRLCVESGQFRGMTEGPLSEFCNREWTIVAGNKIEVEPKDKMKLKTGRSPDEADAVAIGLHGAIRRGFQIARLQPPKPPNPGPDWRDALRKQAAAIWEGGQLEYAS